MAHVSSCKNCNSVPTYVGNPHAVGNAHAVGWDEVPLELVAPINANSE